MKASLKGLKCKMFMATNLESLNKMMNDFLSGKDIILRNVKIETSKYKIDNELKGDLIAFSLFYEKI